jgi:hypothetical protein
MFPEVLVLARAYSDRQAWSNHNSYVRFTTVLPRKLVMGWLLAFYSGKFANFITVYCRLNYTVTTCELERLVFGFCQSPDRF